MRTLTSLALTSLTLLCASPALAEGGFALDRYEPSERGSDWFVGESLDLRGHGRFALGAVGDYAYKPLVWYDSNGDEQAAIVEHQLFVHLGGAVVLFDRLRLGANLPLLAYSKGESLNVAQTSFSTSDKASIGDPRLSADVRLVGEYGGAATLAFGVQGFIPVGNQKAYASDDKVRIRPRLMLAGDLGDLAYAAQTGFNYRAKGDDLGGEAFGSEMTFSAAVGLRALDKKLIVGPEVFGSTVVSDGGDGAFKKRSTPLEVVIGGKYRATPDWRVGAAVGPGLTRGVGAPAVRVLASIEWFPAVEKPAAPSDRDRDGILDADDACPDTPGVRTDDPKTHGCPPAAAPADRDKDGILDADDACPEEPGVKSDDPKKHGCPAPADTDGDGITDDVDACPKEKGVSHVDPSKHGCPAPKDTDGDGILDIEDACPDKAGVADPDPKKHGCPKAKIEGTQIKIMDMVQFETRSAKILPASDGVLGAVLKILQDHPEITKVSVEGHTDNRGGKGFNKDLSKRRAASVVKWLTNKGIAQARLTSTGHGMTKPIDSNDTETGRQNNRRVEFHIQSNPGSTEVKTK